MFNDYIWKTYLKAGGKEIAAFFEKCICDSFTEDSVRTICELHNVYCPSKAISEHLRSELQELSDGINIKDFGFLYACYPMAELDDGEYSVEFLMDTFYQGLNDSGAMTDNQLFSEFSEGMAYYTTFLAMEFPELFVPYYFQYNYNLLEKISNEFDIALPTIPVKRDYKGRIYHYGGICTALYDFRLKYNMTPYELCAFLYDFAPKYIGGTDSYIIKSLPEPKSAFFIGGSKNDAFLDDDSDIISCWQCNPDTRAGDLIVMYLRSPISAVDSIWRSVSLGFNDPFFYYYRCTYIARPKKINRITQKQLQKDSIAKDLPIVRKNMQGINGVELYPSIYNHLLDMAKSDLPRLEYVVDETEGIYAREKDVEDQLIKLFLEKLGYTESEYQQQLYIEIGNHNHALIPDFVIHPVLNPGHQSADFLVEAKITIPSGKLLEEAKTQARGYAILLNARYSVIAAKEGVWISTVDDDYSKDVLVFSWAELKNEDNFFTVFKLIGNGKIKKKYDAARHKTSV